MTAPAAFPARATVPLTARVAVPGCDEPLVVERAPDGALRTIRGGGRLYVDARDPGQVVYGDGMVVVSQTELPGGVLRRVQAGGTGWTERYRWNDMGHLVEVDGVSMSYDAEGRIAACVDAGGTWFYGYSGPHLTVIDTPRGVRHVLRGPDGRAAGFREADRAHTFDYDEAGCRLPGPVLPMAWHVDGAGRLVAISDDDGRIVRTYLWDGRHCLGAIAGAPGAPLETVYSLDPTGTPVRVITSSGVRRIPRDAFGEALLDHPGVPGLFGGAVTGGYVHLPFRRLDPRTGSFDRPDPFDGEAHDPRRMAGLAGPLPLELPPAGPYTVCRNNPVSLADPTGAISDLWWLIPSALTWSLQNTIGSLLGMWFNLEFSPLGWIVSAAAGADPFDVEWIGARNFDAFGLRADGWLSRVQPVAWTYQFLVNEEGGSFRRLEDARLFAPDAAFRPTLQGTFLRCVPADSAVFVLAGGRVRPNDAAVVDWSRCGGTAEPAIPNSRVPVFPDGGLHFDRVLRGVRQQRAELIEVEPSGMVLTGTTGAVAALDVPRTSLGLSPNDLLAITGEAGALRIVRVLSAREQAGRTQVRVDAAAATVTGPLHLEGLTGPDGPEPLVPVAGQARLLDVAGSSLDYVPSVSVVRLSRGGSVVHAARVVDLEARLELDEPVPAALGGGTRVREVVASGTFGGTLGPGGDTFEVSSGVAPGVGEGVLVGTGPAAMPALVRSVDGMAVTTDRTLSSLGAAGTTITWARLAPGAVIGVREDAPEAEARITYRPGAAGRAPDAGFVWLQGATAAVRRVAGRAYDGVLLGIPRPDASADPYDTERFRLAPPDVGGVAVTEVETLALSAPPPAGTTVLHVVPVAGAAPSAGMTLMSGATLAGTVVTASVAPASPPIGIAPGRVVVLTSSGGAPQAAVVQRVRLQVTLERPLPIAVGTSTLEVAMLAPEALAFAAERLADRTIRVRPQVAGVRVDMPRFVPGDLVFVRWAVGTTTHRRFVRVTGVAGTTITYADDEDVVPAATTGLTVSRLVVGDPDTGRARLGLDGQMVSATGIELSVWDTSDFPGGFVLAVVDGPAAYAVRVANVAQPLSIDLALAGPGSGTVDLAEIDAAGPSACSARFTIEGATAALEDVAAMGPAGTSVVVVPYRDTARRVAGELHPGTVRVPDDHENVSLELSRRQSLEDHELMHTVQSARLGPIMLVAFPLWALELATDLTAAGGPAFAPYVAGTLGEGRLTLASAAGFEAGARVQVAQNRRTVFVQIGEAAGGGFRLPDAAARQLGAAGFIDGPVQVRRQQGSTGTDVLEWITNIGQLLTIGGLLNVLSLAGWGGFAAIVVQIVQAIRQASRSRVQAPVADDGVTLTLGAEQALEGLAADGLVALRSGERILIRTVASIEDRTVTLTEPVPLRGTVELSLYSPGSALFGLRRYYPAEVPDEDRPARLRVRAVGEDRPSFSVHDRVEVRSASGTSYRTLVTAVADDEIELEEAVLTRADAPNEFLIGTIGEQDPTGWVDQWLLNELGIGWMQYIHDPWGQILYRAQPSRDDVAAQIAARSARYLFGTQSWMCIFLGYFWNDNAYQRDNPHRSLMEQEASRRSGDTYCPLGTLHGSVEVVGDVARYWLTASGDARDGAADLVAGGQQDAAGVALVQAPTITMPAGAAFAVPGDLYTVTAAGGVQAIGARGFVPASRHLERSAGIYVAFSRPAGADPYDVTAQRGGSITDGQLADSRDAQRAGVATIDFECRPQDVTVTAAGIAIAEDATFDVVPYQRVRLDVTPNAARVYRVTAAGQGTTADVDGLTLTVRGTLGTDDVEVSRYHRFDAASGTFDSGIGPLHLPADLDIGVRRFALRAQDRVPLRASAALDADVRATVQPGARGVLLVPAPLAPVEIAQVVTGTPSLAARIEAETADLPADVQAFLGDGAALSVAFPADEPPEQQATLTIEVSVGPDAASAVQLQCEVVVEPHFTIETTGGGAFAVVRGSAIDIEASDGTPISAAGSLPPGVTSAPAGDGVTVTVDDTFTGDAIVLLVRDRTVADRMARRTLAVT